jgi:hypothetical protein
MPTCIPTYAQLTFEQKQFYNRARTFLPKSVNFDDPIDDSVILMLVGQ